ncbi:hypothetical protein RND71_040136 [Anisodus tanguticus]|uniref:Uncharacterized protein n=1 Tax=Anisodus tanguticus TaxID=243964 RepID=A0AAE1UYH4_9SOLA|nr:hypothetical protein RND71_040136 [Anisodus tanguticus]
MASRMVLSRATRMKTRLQSALEATLIEVEDVSHQHAGHDAVKETGTNETHFNVKIVSGKFDGQNLVKRHRMVYDLLSDELQSGLHALSIVAKTPKEAGIFCSTGTPVQKIVYYFADALQHRIDREMGKMPFTGEDVEVYSTDVEEFIMDLEPAEFAKRPLYAYRQATQFTGIQAILDSTMTAKKVHLIDLSIKSGSQWTTFMQVVADRHECPLKYLKISSVGRSKKMMEDVGRRLSAFSAETLINVSFCFKTVVSDLKNLKIDSFEVEADEVVAFYSDTILWTMLSWADELGSLMEVIKSLNPCIMVVIEPVANTNLSNFIDSFDESLTYFSAIADCFEVHHKGIPICGGFCIQKFIRSMITYHGEETVPRYGNVKSVEGLVCKVSCDGNRTELLIPVPSKFTV